MLSEELSLMLSVPVEGELSNDLEGFSLVVCTESGCKLEVFRVIG